ncbi:MAG: glycosyltransferase family 39 protein, partial [Candidatus Pacebacteria bacterium]|nr:glycosyltransferase family 39 protein [Candidatus Paceibacterota bacterium]
DIPFPDVATRYAPMAEAFSVGNWEFAFHPRIPPVFPALAGCIAYILQTDGFLACKVASAMMLCLGVFPLWGAVKNIYGERHAITAICLYCGCSYLLRLGYGGIRETTSCFGILISYYGMSQLYRNKNSLTGLVCFACGSSILLLNRGDLILFLFFSGIILFVWDICKHIIPWRMVLTAAIIFLSIFPWLCYNYIQIGYPVTDVRHAAAIRFMERKCKFVFPCNPNPRMKLDINMPGMEGAPHE